MFKGPHIFNTDKLGQVTRDQLEAVKNHVWFYDEAGELLFGLNIPPDRRALYWQRAVAKGYPQGVSFFEEALVSLSPAEADDLMCEIETYSREGWVWPTFGKVLTFYVKQNRKG